MYHPISEGIPVNQSINISNLRILMSVQSESQYCFYQNNPKGNRESNVQVCMNYEK